MADLAAFQQRLGYQFRDEGLLRLALTHPSIAHDPGQLVPTPTHQRLEFLGDAVLQLALTHELFSRFAAFGEGPLTKSRAKLVNARSLAAQARALCLGEQLILGRGEEKSGGRDRTSGLAAAYEALLGAIYLDGGLEAAREFIVREFQSPLAELSAEPTIENPKGELQELLQATSPEAPRYEVTAATGPDHSREFECRVTHAGVELARGRGGKVSFTHLIGYAVIRALRDVEAMNYAYTEVEGKPAVVRNATVNLGLAIDIA
ncbi:MAG: ribonuclease III, partial [Verrucomicrobia bacterium]|nr:ribonuclease III [Verrucomicrobiota bacterium]